MLHKISIFLLLTLVTYLKGEEPIQLHTQSELTISNYNGPLNKEALSLMKHAEVLTIKHSKITAVEGSMIADLSNLRSLQFINCSVHSGDVNVEHMLEGAKNLKEFVARHIKTDKLHPEVVRKVPSLEVFSMTHNHYPVLHANIFNETKLKKLELFSNYLETIEDGAFNGLGSLEVLDLNTNKIKAIAKETLAPLKNLRALKVRENEIEIASSENLPDMPNLEFIDVAYNPITVIKLDDIEKIAPKLKAIDLRGTRLIKEQIEDAKAKHPNINFKL